MSEQNGQVPVRASRRRKSIPVEIEQDDGSIKTYTAKEMMGLVRADYMSAVGSLVSRGTSKASKRIGELQPLLISYSLYDDSGKLAFQTDEIQQWPATAINVVFEACQKLNGMTIEEEDEKKA